MKMGLLLGFEDSIATMTELARLKFYATQPHPCSYLPEEQATTLFLDPSQPMDVLVYAELSELGFRRSGDHLYRPHCLHIHRHRRGKQCDNLRTCLLHAKWAG